MTDRQRQFSIVMSVYNQENWLDESFQSLVQQDIGFLKNVEVILVNDGSVDRSSDICRALQLQYPNNVVLIEQENQGLSAARNAGMRVATGQLINFFDPDDMLPQNVFSEVWKFWDERKDDGLPFVTIPLHLVGAARGLHGKYAHFPRANSVIDLNEDPANFVLTSAASFYPRDVLEGKSFDTSMLAAEDSLFNFELLSEFQPRFGFVCERGVKYEYTQHVAGKNQVARSVRMPQGYESAITLLSRLLPERKEETPRYLKELIIYELRQRLIHLKRSYFESEADYSRIVTSYQGFMEYLDPETIKDSPWSTEIVRHYTFSSAFFKYRPWKIGKSGYVEDRGVELFPLSSLAVQVRRINKRPNSIEFETVFFDFYIEGLELVFVSDSGEVLAAVESYEGENEFSKRTGELFATRTRWARFVLPIPEKESRWKIAFRLVDDQTLILVRNVKQWGYSPFRSYDSTVKSIAQDYWLRFETGTKEFWIRRSKTSTLLYNIRSTARLFKLSKKLMLERLFANPTKKIILITDRPAFGDDNGEALFRYVQEERPELKSRTWLLLSKGAPSYKELKKSRRVVTPGSFKHKVLYINSRILISSHMTARFHSPWNRAAMSENADVCDRTFVWLQHGVTQNAVGSAFNRLSNANDMIAVAAAHERSFALRDGSMHNSESIRDTGFPRFDLLEDNSQSQPIKTILYSPTWRTWLTGVIQSDGTHAAKDGFEESQYFRQQRNFLTDTDVLRALKDSGSRIAFLLHPGMAAYSESYLSLESEFVSVLRPGSVKYRDMLNSSSAMITDYSSVFFDFAYLGKPVVFDHTDEQEFREHHYGAGVFDYATEAPGPVARDFEELKEETLRLIQGGGKMEDLYSTRLQELFFHRDKLNSERTMNAALSVDLMRRGFSAQAAN